MKIDILCNDGSPLRVTEASIWGKDGRLGIGGAELALLTLCRGWHDRGYNITLYNNPDNPENSVFPQKTLDEFNPLDSRDYLIVFRSPNERINGARGVKVWFSCDQFTVGDFKQFSRRVDKIVTISPYHAKHFRDMYGIENTITIDLPVRVQDYEIREVPHVPKRCIYTSMPDRGVMQLHAMWPLIHRDCSDASLVITSDWRLWDVDIDASVLMPYRASYTRHPNVSYVGAVKRDKLIEYQLSADVLTYPHISENPELFCITVAEAQCAGAIPVTSQIGALKTTNEFGIQIEGSPYEPGFVTTFARETVRLLNDPCLKERQEEMKDKARKRFSLDRILGEWDRRVFNG